MTVDRVRIAIIGAGPGGMSAAARAAEHGVSHVLLEQGSAHANTIQRYQRGKHVMAEPNVLPLRSPLPFAAGVREQILSSWQSGLEALRVEVRYGSEVVAVRGAAPEFEVELKSGARIAAQNVVLAIGLQGNPRRLGVPGDDLPCVQYTLDDPAAYRSESIAVVGAGDAAIENALGLTGQNTVHIVNRADEFVRVKEGNLSLILKAIDDGKVHCHYSAQCVRVEQTPGEDRPYALVLASAQGEARVPCDRIIARIGATPPRRFVVSCGIRFASADATSLPELTPRYESNVPGLYVIGALGGYPLIKQAMNQGYEVIESLLGHEVVPADEPLLAARFAALPFHLPVTETLALMQARIPLYRDVNALMFRELMLGSTVHAPRTGEAIFRRNDYTNSFFAILGGHVALDVGDEQDARRVLLGAGEFFGEMSLLSGRRRSGSAVAGENCLLIESPRRDIMKLMNSVEAVRAVIDRLFIVRAIQTSFAPDASFAELEPVAVRARLNRYKTDATLFAEDEVADSLHLIRSGSVAVLRTIAGREVVSNYVAAGNYVGEMGLIGRTRRSATVRAAVPTETVSLDADAFDALLTRNPALRASVEATVQKRVAANARLAGQGESGDLISFLLRQGLGEATDVLLIDETLCVGCDNCEKACAETHGGTSRLDRAAGPSFANVHVPTSCRHCEDPHCMKDCPPDAIRRAPNGEVYIRDNCIGCGNCERNCPYDVIHMAATPPDKPGLWPWLLFGAGSGPGEAPHAAASAGPKQAVKCDMCKDLSAGPACVRACPTGAAIRVSPERFVEFVNQAAARR